IVTMTYPLIGNYGTNALDQESVSPHVRGFVIEELSEAPSNWRSEMSLDEYLKKWEIPGVQGIDTRALTRHLRERGAMKACLTSDALSEREAVERAVTGHGVIGMDYVREVSTLAPYQWDPDDRLSAKWSVASGNADERTRRSVGTALRSQIIARLDWKEADLRNLPGPSDSRFCRWGKNLQTKVWASGRQSTGQGFAHGQSGHHVAKSWIRRRCEIAAA